MSKEGIRSPGTRVTDGYELPYGFCLLNLCPLEEQPVLFTTEPHRQPLPCILNLSEYIAYRVLKNYWTDEMAQHVKAFATKPIDLITLYSVTGRSDSCRLFAAPRGPHDMHAYTHTN